MKNSTILFKLLNPVVYKQLLSTGLIIVLLFNFCTVFSSCQKTDPTVLEAFDLRIKGKPEQAKALLLSILETDTTNALAHFELARTLNYMNLMGSEEADQELKSALKYDPKNVVYAFYNAKNCFLKAYIAMHDGGDNAGNLIDKVCNEFIKVLEIKSDYPEALMYLVEIYGILPENMGGNKVKAEEYAQKLEKLDKFYGAKARLTLLPEETDRVNYWSNLASNHTKDCRFWKELGVANLFADNMEGAKQSFTKAMELDKDQNVRLLDLSRYHQMKVMQNRDAAKDELPKSKEYIEQYLASTPAPIPPLKAYAIGMLAKTEMFLGNNAEAEKLMEEAKKIDPYFSRAFGIPSLAIFEPPTKPDHYFTSFFSPF